MMTLRVYKQNMVPMKVRFIPPNYPTDEMMRSWGTDMMLICGSNPTPSGLGLVVRTNSVQGIKIRGETSNMQVDTTKHRNNDKGEGQGYSLVKISMDAIKNV